jgi:post-segregation antitoxin (ccd killing protein)
LGSERLDDLFQAVGESKQPITSVKSYLKDLNMNASNQTGLKNKQTNKKKNRWQKHSTTFLGN